MKVVNRTPGTVFATLFMFFVTYQWAQSVMVLHHTWLESLARNKHCHNPECHSTERCYFECCGCVIVLSGITVSFCSVLILKLVNLSVTVECCYGKCHSTVCHYSECSSAECCSTEYCYYVILLSGITVSFCSVLLF